MYSNPKISIALLILVSITTPIYNVDKPALQSYSQVHQTRLSSNSSSPRSSTAIELVPEHASADSDAHL